MVKKVVLLALVIFFAVGTINVMAEGKTSCQDKSALQGIYDWFAGCGKSGTECCCKACGKHCCANCNTDCGGKCCSGCAAKK